MIFRRVDTARPKGPRGTSSRSSAALGAIALTALSVGLVLGPAAPASARPTTPLSFPTTTADCTHRGWAHFTGVHFRNDGQCVAWVDRYVVRQRCLPAALADFQATGKTYAAELKISLGEFISAVCRGQDFPVSNDSYVVNDPAGTDLVSLSSGNTTPFVTQPGHIYWIEVQGAWNDGLVRQADARFISDNNWGTWSDGPVFHVRNLETQINDKFVNWGPYNTAHNYNYWIVGDGNPINMRVFEGNPATNTPNPALYADNTGPAIGGVAMPAIVFEYALP